jgi:hypothetical protein
MSTFTDAIQHNWPLYKIAPGICADMACCGTEGIDADDYDTLQAYDEGHFSKSSCDSCDQHLAGQRFPAHAIHKNAFGPTATEPDNVHHIDICQDCLMFHANGEEPEE